MREIPDELRGGPFTTRQAAGLGLTRDMLRGTRFRRVGRGLWACADDPPELRAVVQAALLVAPPDALVTGVTGLHLYGVEVGDPLPVRLISTHPTPIRRAGLVVTRTRVLPPNRNRVCLPPVCFAAACASLGLVDAVTAGDWLVRRDRTPQRLTSYAENLHGRWSAKARRAVNLVRVDTDSPRETRLRLCLVLAGLPEPTVNARIGTKDEPIGRFDLVYLRFRIAIEYDGDQHRTDRRQWDIDIVRHEAAAAGGWLVIRITAGMMRDPYDVVRRIHGKLVERGYDGPPPTFTRDWRAAFGA